MEPYPVDQSDIYCIANDWMSTHREKVGVGDWLDDAIKACLAMYPEVNWLPESIQELKYQLDYLS